MLEFHHFYVFTMAGAPEVDHLVSQGFTEGAPNKHPGQGTENRRIFFDNGMIEFIWAADGAEILNPKARRLKLYERSRYTETGYSPFGICVTSDVPDQAPFTGYGYKPAYLPTDFGIWMAANEDVPSEPGIFQLAGPKEKLGFEEQPTRHVNGAGDLLHVSVRMLPSDFAASDAMKKLRSVPLLSFETGTSPFARIEIASGGGPATINLGEWSPLQIALV